MEGKRAITYKDFIINTTKTIKYIYIHKLLRSLTIKGAAFNQINAVHH